MIRIILFLLLIALAGWGASWVAEQPGDVVFVSGNLKMSTTLPRFLAGIGIVVAAAIFLWAVLGLLWRTPGRIRKGRRERRHARGRHAITQGLLAIGHGDSSAARMLSCLRYPRQIRKRRCLPLLSCIENWPLRHSPSCWGS